MKKTIFASLAVLAVLAMTMASCGGGGGTPLPITYPAVVTYDLNGGTVTTTGDDTITVSSTIGGFITLIDATGITPPSGTPYLIGWNDANGDTVGVPGAPYLVAASVTLTAAWGATAPETPATVSYALGEGTGTAAPQSAAVGETIQLHSGTGLTGPAATPYLTGWSDGTTTYLPGAHYLVTGDITLTAVWGATAPVIPPEDEEFVEEVTLNNGWFVIYKFTLPVGKTWGDYKKVKADYKLADATKEIRARLFGNYVQSEVDQVRLGEYNGGKIAVVASWPSGDTGSWILDNTWAGNGAPNTLLPIYPGGNEADPRGIDAAIGDDEWFTLTYPQLGSNPHGQQNNGNNATTGDYYRYKEGRRPADSATGPFYLGVGITVGIADAGKEIVSQIKNVILFGAGVPDVTGEPLFIKKDGALYRAFAGQIDGIRDGTTGYYPNLNSGTPKWEIKSGEDSITPVNYVELDPITVTYAANYPNSDAVTGLPEAVTFYPGSRFDGTQASATVGLPTTPPATPAGAAWAFNGWFTEATGGVKVVDRYQFDASATIYAQWGIIQPAFITYNVGNGAGTAPANVSVAKGTGTLTAAQLGKGSLTGTGDKTVFGGFYSVDTTGATFNYADYSKLVTTATTFAADATIYAYWYKPVAAADLVVGEDVEVTVAGAWGARIDEDGFVIFASGTNNGYLGVNGNDTLLNLGLAAGADLSTYSTCTISYEFKWIVEPVLTAEQTTAGGWVGDAAGIWKKYNQGTNNGGPSGGSYFSFKAEGGDLVHNNLNNFKATDTATTYDGISVQINAGDDNNNKQRRNGIFGVKITDVVFE